MKQKFKIELVFPILVITFSLIGLISQLDFFNIPSLITSVIGLSGAILYFLNINFYKTLIYIWITSQVVIITGYKLDHETEQFIYNPIWDTSQLFSIKLGFSFNATESSGGLYINGLAIALFGLLHILKVSELVGQEVTFKKFGKSNKLGNIFPLTGTVEKRVNLSDEKDWLFVTLHEPFQFRDQTIDRVFIKAKEDKPLKKEQKGQLAYFRLIPNVVDLDINQSLNKKDYRFIDWVLVK